MNKLQELEAKYKELGAEIERLKADEFEYPIFKRSKTTGIVIRFTDIENGTIVFKGGGDYNVGYYSDWVYHTDTEIYEDVAYNKEKDLYDGQPIWCWCNVDTHEKTLRFYDAVNDCIFTYDGNRDGIWFKYLNYKPYEYEVEHINEWLIEASKTLKR